ncbi:hypothetical protein QF035_010647 [Streptomyces umbrinus]|uniref:Uncharacterized protein n=1 Tax=Streptomyces umbrinus TaxID=67370 RepID=A0ABU0TB68_9ACTN|nr:hypothetical protein [Streptomyces umbrinus]
MNPIPTNHPKPGTTGLTKDIEAPPRSWLDSLATSPVGSIRPDG